MSIEILTDALTRLSKDEEAALNVMLARYGGTSPTGLPYYKIEWAPESNARTVPLCFFGYDEQGGKTPEWFSYHMLSWEPPEQHVAVYEHALHEDLSKGSYACLTHFIDRETGKPFAPGPAIIECIIPVILEVHEIARAAQIGAGAELQRLRKAREQKFYDGVAQQKRAYEAEADAILNDTTLGSDQPTSYSGDKHRMLSDLTLSDIARLREARRAEKRFAFVPREK